MRSIHCNTLKISAFACILALMFCTSACGNNQGPSETKSLYTQGLDIIQLMSEMTQSEDYVDIYTGSSEIKSIVQNISSGNFSTPKNVYAISITKDTIAAITDLNHLDNASEGLRSFLVSRFLSSLMTQLNGRSSVENLAAASVCTVSKTFVNENVNEDVIYLYTFDNAVPAAVTFTAGENHSVSAAGVFILYDDFPCGSADEIKSFFKDIAVDVTEVTPE